MSCCSLGCATTMTSSRSTTRAVSVKAPKAPKAPEAPKAPKAPPSAPEGATIVLPLRGDSDVSPSGNERGACVACAATVASIVRPVKNIFFIIGCKGTAFPPFLQSLFVMNWSERPKAPRSPPSAPEGVAPLSSPEGDTLDFPLNGKTIVAPSGAEGGGLARP